MSEFMLFSGLGLLFFIFIKIPESSAGRLFMVVVGGPIIWVLLIVVTLWEELK